MIQLGQKSGSRLYRKLSRSVATCENRRSKMGDAFKPFLQAAYKKLSTPNCSVVAVSGAVEAHAGDAFGPFAALREHRSDVSAMMLHKTSVLRGRDFALTGRFDERASA